VSGAGPTRAATGEALALDRLPDAADAVAVERLDGLRFRAGDSRAPHRHDYHELIWVAEGSGEGRASTLAS